MRLPYEQLVQKLGEPTVEKLVVGTAGFRFDKFPCGCTRIVRMGDNLPQVDEKGRIVLPIEVKFHPCDAHAAELEGVQVE